MAYNMNSKKQTYWKEIFVDLENISDKGNMSNSDKDNPWSTWPVVHSLYSQARFWEWWWIDCHRDATTRRTLFCESQYLVLKSM